MLFSSVQDGFLHPANCLCVSETNGRTKKHNHRGDRHCGSVLFSACHHTLTLAEPRLGHYLYTSGVDGLCLYMDLSLAEVGKLPAKSSFDESTAILSNIGHLNFSQSHILSVILIGHTYWSDPKW